MPYLIPKTDTPNAQYTKMVYKDEIVMMTVINTGVVLIFTGRTAPPSDALYVPWDELVDYAATSPNRKRFEEAVGSQDPDKKPPVREVKPK